MTQVIIATEVRVSGDGAGGYFALHPAAAYQAWKPYVDAFGSINLIARHDGSLVDGTAQRVTGPGVSVIELPTYRGLPGLVLALPKLFRLVASLGSAEAVFIGRIPEPISIILWLRARAARARFVSVVVAEPRQVWQFQYKGAIGRALGSIMAGLTRRIVRSSVAVVYVTQNWLQELYPADSPALARSNVILKPTDVLPGRLSKSSPGETVRLVTIGSLATHHKGVDSLISVVADLSERGVDVSADVIGDGALRDDLVALAGSSHLGAAFRFHGAIHDRAEINKVLDSADIYVSCSRAEGLPRSVVEGMSRGLPVVATDAGGTSELVLSENLVALDDVQRLSDRVAALATDEAAYRSASKFSSSVALAVAESADPAKLSEFLKANLTRGAR